MYITYSILLYFLVCDSLPSILAQAVSHIGPFLSPNSSAPVLELTESTTASSFTEIKTRISVKPSSFVSATSTELLEPINITETLEPGLSSSDLSQILPSESNPRATSTTIEWITASLPPSTTTTTITFPLIESKTALSESGTSVSAFTSSTNTGTSEVFLSTPQFTSLVSSSILISTSTSALSVALSTSNSAILTPSETGISGIPTETPFSSAELSSIAPSASLGALSSSIEPLASSTAISTTDFSITTLLNYESSTPDSSTALLPESTISSTIIATLSTIPINSSILSSSTLPSVTTPGPSSFVPVTTVPSPPSRNSGSGSSARASDSNDSSLSASGSGNGSSPSDSIATITPQIFTTYSDTTNSYQSETSTADIDTVLSTKTSDVPSIIEPAASPTGISPGTDPIGTKPTSSTGLALSSSEIVSSKTLSGFDTSTKNSSTTQVNTEPYSGASHTLCPSTTGIISSTLDTSTTTAPTLTDLVPSSSLIDETISSDNESLISTTSGSISGFFIESLPTVTPIIISTTAISTNPTPVPQSNMESTAQSLSVPSVPVTVNFVPGDMAESKTTTYLSSVYTLIQVYTRSPTSSVIESSSSPILPN
ncbi:hypothetical protein BCIN_06g01780 [Botrytis cinerea B05.10]|uniref:Uncharacterized protein n=2 Tax=Botryotinia fuckeliana TaxID=40559 RepID=A0A384JJC1_BOTFB|nr:hypothetical protein BCIN_06g01780 [Botrytis cinerea B05.10]ATZ50685.1 hypothetical protein BCIN_06g01780 [Botrytis cinerea B05.10]EMR88441.1 hypothetical protein BcDW1_2779 [Botrytis cinerea BcDW1]